MKTPATVGLFPASLDPLVPCWTSSSNNQQGSKLFGLLIDLDMSA